LSLSRAGIGDLRVTAGTFGGLIDAVVANPARLIRSAVEMSRMAVFTDGGRAADRTNWPSTVISYYSFGGAIAIGLDLMLREKTNGRVTLDDYMRAMWRVHGKPGGSRPGYVDHPYTLADAERQLALVSGDERFARDFFSRYIEGHEVVDYTRLLAQAGIVVRKRNAGRAWWGDLRVDTQNEALRVSVPPQIGTPAYAAGLDLGDEVREIDGRRVTTVAEVNDALARHRPGESMSVTFVNRSGVPQTRQVALVEDPHVQAMTVETTGGTLSPEQKAFREKWLGR
jgi:predicted metalloprotease with PDZ domain